MSKIAARGHASKVRETNFPLEKIYKTAKERLLYEGRKTISTELRQETLQDEFKDQITDHRERVVKRAKLKRKE